MSAFGPVARRDPGSGFELHGRWFADPYAWMECIDDAETRAWIAGQEAATRRVLDAVPGREWLRAGEPGGPVLASVGADIGRAGSRFVLGGGCG